MAKKNKKVNAPPPADRHTTPRAVFHLPPELLAIIDAQAEMNERSRTGEILRILKAHYRDLGLWPPPPSEDSE